MFPVNFIILLLITLVAHALPSDSKEKLHIKSDTSTYNYKTGVNTFDGHVTLDQGTSHITADRLITQSNASHKIQEATAYGLVQPAHYWTLPTDSKPEVHAHAGIIKYFPIAANIAMERNVYVTQGKNIFQGQLVLYNMTDQTITVPANTNGRSVLVYNPDEPI